MKKTFKLSDFIVSENRSSGGTLAKELPGVTSGTIERIFGKLPCNIWDKYSDSLELIHQPSGVGLYLYTREQQWRIGTVNSDRKTMEVVNALAGLLTKEKQTLTEDERTELLRELAPDMYKALKTFADAIDIIVDAKGAMSEERRLVYVSIKKSDTYKQAMKVLSQIPEE